MGTVKNNIAWLNIPDFYEKLTFGAFSYIVWQNRLTKKKPKQSLKGKQGFIVYTATSVKDS